MPVATDVRNAIRWSLPISVPIDGSHCSCVRLGPGHLASHRRAVGRFSSLGGGPLRVRARRGDEDRPTRNEARGRGSGRGAGTRVGDVSAWSRSLGSHGRDGGLRGRGGSASRGVSRPFAPSPSRPPSASAGRSEPKHLRRISKSPPAPRSAFHTFTQAVITALFIGASRDRSRRSRDRRSTARRPGMLTPLSDWPSVACPYVGRCSRGMWWRVRAVLGRRRSRRGSATRTTSRGRDLQGEDIRR